MTHMTSLSSTEPSRLKLCKAESFHGGHSEECSLLGYENPVRSSHETHYVSAAEPKAWLAPKTDRRKLKTDSALCCLLYITLRRPNRKPGFATVGYQATRQYRVVSVPMETFDHGYVITTKVLHSNDGPRSNTPQYIYIYIYIYIYSDMFVRMPESWNVLF
jgi:hypothetical protein